MQELIQKITAAAGISEEQAKKSIETVSAYLKEKLPASFRSQIDNLVNGGKLSEGIKMKMGDMADDVKDKAEELIKEVREEAEQVAGKIRDIFSEKKDDKSPKP